MAGLTIYLTNENAGSQPYNWVIKQGETEITSQAHLSGDTWDVVLAPGEYIFLIDSPEEVGIWSGSMIFNNDPNSFTQFGVGYNATVSFSISEVEEEEGGDDVATWTIGDVEFPFSPSQISDEVDAVSEEFPLDGIASILFGTGVGVRQVMISGTIYSPAQDKDDLESAYIASLRGYQGTQQTVESPSGTYDGDWLVKKVSFKEQAEGSIISRILYSITLWKPAVLVIL